MEFLKRNQRSRGEAMKAQYVRIQAETLRETGKPDLARAAIELLEDHYFPLYFNAVDCAAAYCCAAKCSERVASIDDAIRYCRRAIQREVEFPNSLTNAALLLARLAVELGQSDLVSEALVGTQRALRGILFPWEIYVEKGARAFLCSGQR